MTDEEPRLLRTEKGFTAVWKAVYIYPSSNPVEYARRKARAAALLPRTLVLVPSVGLGHGLEDLLQRLPDGCAVLCVEAYQQLLGLAMAHGLPRDARLHVVRADTEDAVIQALRSIGTARFRRVAEVPLSAGYRLAPSFYAGLRRRLEAEIREHWRNRLTLIALGSLQVRNVLSNLANLPGARDFSRLSTERPVVVAGAGPSLEGTLAELRAVRDRVLLVAVDTALPRLMAESLAPDVVVALEAQTTNLEDFIPRPAPHTILACDLSSHPAVPRLFAEKVFFFSSAFAPLRLFRRMEDAGLLPCPFPPLGSVGVAAVHAALRLTKGAVFMTGLDFSFPGRLTHARGTPRHTAGLASTARTAPAGSDAFRLIAARSPVSAPDKNGLPVVTDSVLRSYRDALAATLAAAEHRVYDVGTTGLDLGARKAGAEELAQLVRAAASEAAGASAASDAPEAPGAHVGGLQAPAFSADRVRSFLSAELRTLAGGEELLRAALRGASPSAECIGFLNEADYTWIHFPDAPAPEALQDGARQPSFIARAGVAVRYYAERLERAASLL